MPPTDQNNQNVWVSKEEYERLRALEERQSSQWTAQQATSSTDLPADAVAIKAEKSQRTWQIVLGVILSAGLYFSVASGSGANIFLVLAILIFGGVSLVDFMRAKRLGGSGGDAQRTFKHNPYKVLVVLFAVVTILPGVAFMALFMLFLTLGGGDVGS